MTDTPDLVDQLASVIEEAAEMHCFHEQCRDQAKAVLNWLDQQGRLRSPRRRRQPGETVIETEFARVVGVNDQLRAENERLRHRLLQGGTCCEHDPAEHTDNGCMSGWTYGPTGAVAELGCQCKRKGVAS